MTFRKLCLSVTVSAALALSACGGKSNIKLDSTDGITLDGTFQEAIEGYEKADQLKAATGLLIYAYEGAGNTDIDYIREAKEEASFLVDPKGGNNIFESRGSVLNNIATESGGVLNGKTAQNLIDKYNIATQQYDEYLKDQEEIKAAKEAEKAAAAEARRLKALSARRAELEKMQADVTGAAAANKAKLDKLKSEYDKARADADALNNRQNAMTGDVVPARGLNRLSDRLSGQVTVIIINTTDAPIKSPVVQVSVSPKGQPDKRVKAREASLYKFEQKKIAIAPGGQSAPMFYSISPKYAKGSALSQGGRDFSNVDFDAKLVGYQTADGKKVSLKLDAAAQNILNNYKNNVAKCNAANAAIDKAKTTIPAAIERLNAPDADIDAVPKLPATRC